MRKVNNIYTIIMLGLLLAACQKTDKKESEEKEENSKETDNKEMTVEEKDPSKMADKNTLPNFTAKDQDGNPFTNEDIAKNDATVINLWFTGCSACVEEMDELNNIADELKKDDGVDFVSMCTDVNYDDSTKEAYQRIIKEKNPNYKALAVDYEGDMKNYLENIFVYPTTIVVDKNGNVIGDPVEGSLVSEDQQAKLKENIKKAIESSQASK